MSVKIYLDKKRNMIDKALLGYLPRPQGPSSELVEAMRYSVKAPGKRIRPVLMLAIADMLNKPHARVLPAACAVEYVHTSTLILDDLPCMDDSDLRRGEASVHKRFGQSTAILAAYSLMTLAFEILSKDPQAARSLSQSIGASGVCAGQYVDLKSGSGKIGLKTLRYLHAHKTADLFAASCWIAGHLCGADDSQKRALSRYGGHLGLAFQTYDDMLSINKTDTQLGKRTKKDKYSPNVVNLFGQDKAKGLLGSYVKKAKTQLSPFGAKAKTLRRILDYVICREK
jgi:geranylgeranyl diphosphate synthase type II